MWWRRHRIHVRCAGTLWRSNGSGTGGALRGRVLWTGTGGGRTGRWWGNDGRRLRCGWPRGARGSGICRRRRRRRRPDLWRAPCGRNSGCHRRPGRRGVYRGRCARAADRWLSGNRGCLGRLGRARGRAGCRSRAGAWLAIGGARGHQVKSNFFSPFHEPFTMIPTFRNTELSCSKNGSGRKHRRAGLLAKSGFSIPATGSNSTSRRPPFPRSVRTRQ
jgi:hypothetical protein